MSDVNVPAIVVAAVLVFAFAAVYYSVLAAEGARLGAPWAQGSRPSSREMLVEIARAIVVSAALALVIDAMGVTAPLPAALVALGLWLAFPVVLLLGSVTHERVAPRLAAIHAGDWLAKLVVIAVVVTVWP